MNPLHRSIGRFILLKQGYRLGGLPLILLLLCSSWMGAATPSVWELARPAPRPAGSPKYSDVCFSSRWERPRDASDSNDSFQVARTFHATQWVWLYPERNRDFKSFVTRIKATGATANCAVNNILTDTPLTNTRLKGRQRTLGGKFAVPFFMRVWPGVTTGCSIHPDFFEIYVAEGKRLLDCGADSIQDDAMSLNDMAGPYGGCFCDACVTGFRIWLATHLNPADRSRLGVDKPKEFDYRAYLLEQGTAPDANVSSWKGDPELKKLYLEFQHQGVVSFYRRAHEAWDAHAGRHVPVSRNEHKDMLEWSGPPLFDFGITEWYGSPSVPAFWDVIRGGREKNTTFVLTYAQFGVPANRIAIAASYAYGGHVVVPWDVFTGSATPRIFGTGEEFGDLFGFVRGVAPYLDGYEDAGTCSFEGTDPRWGNEAVVHLATEGKMYGTVRAQPGKPGTPVVVHLVDAGKKPMATKVVLNLSRFGGQPVTASLLEPRAYEPVAHEKARVERSYGSLVTRTELSAGEKSILLIPPLERTWAILVLTPVTRPGQVIQPVFQGPSLWFEDSLRCSLFSPTVGGAVHYTLDGSAPGAGSARATGSLMVEKSSLLRAVTLRETVRSEEISLHLRKRERFDFENDPSLVLWCRAEDLAANHGDGESVKVWTSRKGPSPSNLSGRKYANGMPVAPPRLKTYQQSFPIIQFNGVDESLSLPGFVNREMSGGFTVFLVTRSEDHEFGISGNGDLGEGGVPRLYLLRRYFAVNELTNKISLANGSGMVEAQVFQWDGKTGMSAGRCGQPLAESRCGPVERFDGDGSLAVPHWASSRSHGGDLAEILVFKRVLTEDERNAVSRMLNKKYGL